jgi:hypothetical protein
VLALVDFVPRIGETVVLEVGTAATLKEVRHEVVTSSGFATPVPTVVVAR